MKANTIGEFMTENVLREDYLLNSGEPLETITPMLAHMDGLSFVVCSDAAVRVITANGTTDNVVALTHTFEFENGGFGDGDIGGSFALANSDEGNDATYTIATVVDENTVTTTEAPTADETFTDSVTATLTDLDLEAEITVQVSNNYVRAAGTVPTLGQLPNAGRWPDVTSQFSPAPAAISGDSEQFFQMSPVVAGHAKLTITPSAGAGKISIYYNSRGNR